MPCSGFGNDRRGLALEYQTAQSCSGALTSRATTIGGVPPRPDPQGCGSPAAVEKQSRQLATVDISKLK